MLRALCYEMNLKMIAKDVKYPGNIYAHRFHQRRRSDFFNGCLLVHLQLIFLFTKHRFELGKIHSQIKN